MFNLPHSKSDSALTEVLDNGLASTSLSLHSLASNITKADTFKTKTMLKKGYKNLDFKDLNSTFNSNCSLDNNLCINASLNASFNETSQETCSEISTLNLTQRSSNLNDQSSTWQNSSFSSEYSTFSSSDKRNASKNTTLDDTEDSFHSVNEENPLSESQIEENVKFSEMARDEYFI